MTNILLSAALVVTVVLGVAVVGWLTFAWGQLRDLDSLDADDRHARDVDEAAAWSRAGDIVNRHIGGGL